MSTALQRARQFGSLRSLYRPTITYGIDYGSVSGGKVLDAYSPPGISPVTIVHVHGGGWSSSTACASTGELHSGTATRNIVGHLVSRGFCVLNIEYALHAGCTGNTSDTTLRNTMIEDVKAAVQWARLNYGSHNGGPFVAVMGESAGGHLALMSVTNGVPLDGVAAPELLGSRADACIAWSAPTRLDLVPGAAPGGTAANYVGVEDARSGAGQTAAQLVSPYNQWDAGIETPVRIAMYSAEPIGRQDDGTDMRDAILAASGTVSYNEITGAFHADFSGVAEMDNAVAWLRGLL